jgi:hypothetical protein
MSSTQIDFEPDELMTEAQFVAYAEGLMGSDALNPLYERRAPESAVRDVNGMMVRYHQLTGNAVDLILTDSYKFFHPSRSA